jgi:uncharacterized protein YcbK (DUF882 family)
MRQLAACFLGQGTAGRVLFWRGNHHVARKPRPSFGRTGTWLRLGAAALALTVAAGGKSFAEDHALKLYNLHTHERATIVFKRNGVYDRGGLQALNVFLRDWRADSPTRMDPHLLDLIWQVYQQSGSHDYIQVVCGYRSPPTNAMLRRRSNGVAKNSMHMQGKAMDFYIPDVPLAKLRAIGLRMQIGGVGFYPTSGSPFVHMDTGSVRHWPRMTREQLVRVFPNGNTLHVPSDGRPLPGYEQALAAYQARKAGMTPDTKVASFGKSPVMEDVKGSDAVLVADTSVDDEAAGDAAVAADLPASAAAPALATRAVGTAVAAYATTPVPLPRLAPRPAQPVAVAALSAAAPDDITAPARPPLDIATLASLPLPDDAFGNPQDWTAPAVPAVLAAAMAERDQTRRSASLPIAPTAVVATIDLTRPLRAEAITTAVLRGNGDAAAGNDVPRLLAYAPANLPDDPAVYRVPPPRVISLKSVASAPVPTPHLTAPARPMMTPQLTMTALDTRSLRMWIGAISTRQKSYAVLTMPDFTPSNADLMGKPDVAFAAGFGRYAYADLRTDHFSGALVEQPAVVDLRNEAFVASTR